MKAWSLGFVLLVSTTLLTPALYSASKTEKGSYRYSLQNFKGKKNLVLIFSPRDADGRFKNQIEFFQKAEKKIREASLGIFYIFPDEAGRADDLILRAGDAESLRKDFKVGEKDFLIVFYSKDQKILARKAEPQSLEAILKVFDKK